MITKEELQKDFPEYKISVELTHEPSYFCSLIGEKYNLYIEEWIDEGSVEDDNFVGSIWDNTKENKIIQATAAKILKSLYK